MSFRVASRQKLDKKRVRNGSERLARGASTANQRMNLPHLWVHTCSGPSIGFGHVRRAIVLARMLSDEVAPVFVLGPGDRWTREQVRGIWDTKDLDSADLWRGEHEPVGLLVDTRETDRATLLVEDARERKIPVASIHDLGLARLPSDIVIDGSVQPSLTNDWIHGPDRVYAGPSYQVINPDFRRMHRLTKPISKRIKKIVVNLGGGDCRPFFEVVLEGLARCNDDLEVTGLSGFTNWGQDRLGRGPWDHLLFRWADRNESIADLFFDADLIITAAGVSCYEAMCVGAPVIAMARDSFQEVTVKTLARGGAVLGWHADENLDPGVLKTLVCTLNENEDRRRELSHAGRELVDGLGAERVATILRKEIHRAGQGAGCSKL